MMILKAANVGSPVHVQVLEKLSVPSVSPGTRVTVRADQLFTLGDAVVIVNVSMTVPAYEVVTVQTEVPDAMKKGVS